MKCRVGVRVGHPVERRPLVGGASRLLAELLVGAVLVAACADASVPAGTEGPTANPNAGAIRVAAATSLKEVFSALKAPFEAGNPGTRLVLTFGLSQALVSQVQLGGFDVFAADDLKLAQAIVENRHAAGPAQAFANDPIVIVVPTANHARIAGPKDLARPGVRIATAATAAPLTSWAAQALARLATLPGYTVDYAAAIASNTKPLGEDGRAVLAAVENGEADAAFVYASDARTSSRASVVALPDEAKISATFGVVIMATAADPVAASTFARWLTTSNGQKALVESGFDLPGTT